MSNTSGSAAHPRRLVARDGPGRRLSSDKPWCPRMTKASHDASGGRCREGESRFLTCMSASRRGGAILQSPHRHGSFSSANQTADVPPASDVDQGRESVAPALENGRIRAAVALWRSYSE